MASSGDVLVLGAGIVGVSVALHLQMRGRQTVLVDRQAPGEATSFGNAGLIQSEAVMPQLFPRALGDMLRYARNRATDVSYHPAMLPGLLGPFLRYWRHSRPDRALAIARARAPLIGRAVADHLELATAAGAAELLRPTGYTEAHASRASLDATVAEAESTRRAFGVAYEAMDAAALARHEPQLRPGLAGGLHFPGPVAVFDPHALTMAYVGLFIRLGGIVRIGDARGLARAGGGWRLATPEGPVEARQAVVAMGAWSAVVTKPLGYAPPLFVKRGYHMHYGMAGNAFLNRPVLDAARGYVLAPMRGGVRLTTGAEFAHREAEPTPVQLARVEPSARALVPALGEQVDAAPWMGQRPCLPDMLPVIGPAPRQPGLWYAFGHAHQGLTLGPTTGRLLADMMTGEAPFTDPTPYRADRF